MGIYPILFMLIIFALVRGSAAAKAQSEKNGQTRRPAAKRQPRQTAQFNPDASHPWKIAEVEGQHRPGSMTFVSNEGNCEHTAHQPQVKQAAVKKPAPVQAKNAAPAARVTEAPVSRVAVTVGQTAEQTGARTRRAAFSQNEIINGVIWSEILNKPAALRRR